jgi:hypothetical protein
VPPTVTSSTTRLDTYCAELAAVDVVMVRSSRVTVPTGSVADVPDPAGHLAADGDAAVPVGEGAVLDHEVLAGHVDPAAVGVPPGLDRDAVVAGVEHDPSMTTPVQDSGSNPSVCGPEELIETPSTVTLLHRFGFRCQNGELMMVTPWMSTVSVRNGWIICGGR